jgi:hypothetical protein
LVWTRDLGGTFSFGSLAEMIIIPSCSTQNELPEHGKLMKPCKMFYDMDAFGIEEFEFETWEEAFKFWKDEKPPGPLVKTIRLLNLSHYNVGVSPPGHTGNELWLNYRLGWLLPGQTHDPKYYTGRSAMLMGHPIQNPAFSQKAYNKAVEDREWDAVYFQKTGKHWQGHEERKDEPKASLGKEPQDAPLDHASCLQILGLKPGFSKQSLKKAYNKAVTMNHPDKVPPHLDTEFRELAERKTKQINQAYEMLKRTMQ